MFATEDGFENALIGIYIDLKSDVLYGKNMTMGFIENLAQHWDVDPESVEDYMSKYDYENAQVEDAIEEILSSVENNKAEMRALIELLCSYYRNRDENKKVIDGDDVATVITREKGENGYTLFKAVAKRDLEEALMIIKSIALNDPSRLISTLSTLTVEFKTTENAIALKERGLSEKEIQKEAKGIATSFQTKGFNFRRKEGIYLCMRNYTKEDIKRIIIYLVNADTELKKAGSDAEDLFEDLLYNIIVNSARERKEDIVSRLEVKLV